MRKEHSILITVSALLCAMLIGYFLTRPSNQQDEVLNRQAAALGRFSGTLDQGLATTLPLPDGLFQVATDIVLAPVADPTSSDILYYHADNGFVSRADIASRQSTLISQTALPGLRDVIWSPNRIWVVTTFSGQGGPVFQYFNYQIRIHGTLPASVVGAAFSPDSSLLALAQQIGDQTDIIIAQPDGTDQRTILKTHLAHVTISWPQAHTLALTAKDDIGLASLYLLADNGGLTKIIDSETGLRTNWSPDGSKLLYWTAEGGLMIYDIAINQYHAQALATTADRCAWYANGQSIICAIDDKGETKIQRLNLADNSIQTIVSNVIISPERMFLSSDQNFLIILSGNDHTLYALKLQP